jgi:hypothetical protein
MNCDQQTEHPPLATAWHFLLVFFGQHRRPARLPAGIGLATLLCLISLHSALGVNPTQTSVTLAWDPSPSTNVVGYTICYGPVSGSYTNVISVGNTNRATISGLTVGATYYFAATAVDNQGLQSVYSTEVGCTAQIRLSKLRMSLNTAKQILLTGTGPAGYQYDVLAGSSCTNWTAVGSVTVDATGSLQFTDPASATNSIRYYRLRQSAP